MPEGSSVGRVVLGITLVTVGVLLLALQALGPDLGLTAGRIGWPLLIIAPGVALLTSGLLVRHEAGGAMAIAGAVVIVVGLLMGYQTATGNWWHWAYSWALVAPAGLGAGLLLWGALHRRRDLAIGGGSALVVGLILFAIGFGVFEGIFGLSDDSGLSRLAGQALPVALIAAGVLMLATRLVRGRAWARVGRPGRPPD